MSQNSRMKFFCVTEVEMGNVGLCAGVCPIHKFAGSLLLTKLSFSPFRSCSQKSLEYTLTGLKPASEYFVWYECVIITDSLICRI